MSNRPVAHSLRTYRPIFPREVFAGKGKRANALQQKSHRGCGLCPATCLRVANRLSSTLIVCSLFPGVGQFFPTRETAGRYRAHRRRVREAAQDGRAESHRAVPVSQGEDRFLFSKRRARLLLLLRLSREGRRLHLRHEDGEHQFPRSGACCRREGRSPAAEA